RGGRGAPEAASAVAGGERLEALGRAQGRGELGAEITPALVRRADVGEDEILQVLVGDAAADQPQRRQAQALAEYFRDRAVTAGRGGAYVRPVRTQAGVTDEQPGMERGPH